MDDEIVIIGDDGTEHVFPAGFDPQRAAEIVRGDSGSQPSSTMATPAAMAGLGVAAAAPAVVSGLHALATAGGALATSRAAKLSPAVVAVDAAGRVARGDYKGAATSAATSAALTQAPKVLKAIQRATQPTRGVTATGARWALKPGAGGAITRGAGWIARVADQLSIPTAIASLMYDAYVLSKEKPLHDAPQNIQGGRPWE